MEMGLIVTVMKKITKLTCLFAMLLASVSASAQNQADPAGSLTYCLPSTVLTLEVDAVQEKFFAGPYAKFAEKYLGVSARQKDETTFRIVGIKMVPYVEADQSKRYSLSVQKGMIDGSFLKMSSCGLVSFGDAVHGTETVWRFPVEVSGDFSSKGVMSNLTSESATLYKNDKKDVYGKVSVQQNVIVAKSLEKKASETANMILQLRKQRLQIVTGDTDATYSGEAMGAAVKELTRLEQEYMTLFTGYTEYQKQTMNFDVIPDPSRESQRYVAFRLSDTAGLLPADNLSGRPVVIEFVPQQFMEIVEEVPEVPLKKNGQPKKIKEPKNKEIPVLAYFRIPAVCTVKMMDGVELLLQSRIPVYQLGQESSFPVNVILK